MRRVALNVPFHNPQRNRERVLPHEFLDGERFFIWEYSKGFEFGDLAKLICSPRGTGLRTV